MSVYIAFNFHEFSILKFLSTMKSRSKVKYQVLTCIHVTIVDTIDIVKYHTPLKN